MDISASIAHLLPAAAKYGGSTTANTEAAYDALRWNDSRRKPSWSQIETAFAEIKDSLLPHNQERVRLKEQLDAKGMFRVILETIAVATGKTPAEIRAIARQVTDDIITP